MRAERDGDGKCRLYAIAVTATGRFGGTCTGTVSVDVPVQASWRRGR